MRETKISPLFAEITREALKTLRNDLTLVKMVQTSWDGEPEKPMSKWRLFRFRCRSYCRNLWATFLDFMRAFRGIEPDREDW